FSSRRRHTRSKRDWSSDVCSSDLSQGILTELGRSSALEVVAPGPEAALALVGAARRLGVTAKAREVRQADRVIIRDAETITTLRSEERRVGKEISTRG